MMQVRAQLSWGVAAVVLAGCGAIAPPLAPSAPATLRVAPALRGERGERGLPAHAKAAYM